MSLLDTPINAGKLSGMIYTFEQAGDVLPMHTHTEGNAHITIVARGRVKAHGNEWSAEYSAGAVIDFPSNQSHEFVALEDDTRIVNITK
jgi:quercetin dioxygenase-like cupin family protein